MDFNQVMVIVLKLLALLALVLLNGFFVAAEFALVKVRDTQLAPLIRKGSSRARVTRHVLEHLDQYLSAAQLGITLASLGLGWIGEPVFKALLSPLMQWIQIESDYWRRTIAFVVGFTMITMLHISAGEQAPKWLAIQKPLPTALTIALPLNIFYRVAYPFIWILNQTSLWLLRRFGIEPEKQVEGHSEEELRLLFIEAQKQERALNQGGPDGDTTRFLAREPKSIDPMPLGRRIVLNALDLRRRVVRDVMRPRHEITALDTEASLTECLNTAERTRYSRFPLCERGNLDKTLGVVHIKDLFAMRFRARVGADFLPRAKKLIYVPETARLEKLLHLLLGRKLHFAIVVDEYGGTVGMVTLENILEELVGQIQDEFDQEESLVEKAGAGAWKLLGALPVRELAQLLGDASEEVRKEWEEEGITTTSGWVTQRIMRKTGELPKAGDVLALGQGAFELRVEEMDGQLVIRLTLKRVKPEQPG